MNLLAILLSIENPLLYIGIFISIFHTIAALVSWKRNKDTYWPDRVEAAIIAFVLGGLCIVLWLIPEPDY